MDIDKQYDYKAEPGPLRMLGVLCVILSPTTVLLSFQETGSPQHMTVINKGYFFSFNGPIVPWIVRLFALALIPVGIALFKGAKEQAKFGGRIIFTPHGFIYEAGPPAGTNNLIKYGKISDVRVVTKGDKSTLYFMANDAKRFVLSKSMKSMDEFNEMAAMLTERVKASQTA